MSAKNKSGVEVVEVRAYESITLDKHKAKSNGRVEGAGPIYANQSIINECYFATNIYYKIQYEVWNPTTYIGGGKYDMRLRTKIKVEYYNNSTSKWTSAGEYSERFITSFVAHFSNELGNFQQHYSNQSNSLAGNYELEWNLATSYDNTDKWYVIQMQGNYTTKVYPFYAGQSGAGCNLGYYSNFIYWF